MNLSAAFSKSLFALAALGLFAAVPACASPQETDDAAASENAITATTVENPKTISFAGTFAIRHDGYNVKVRFWVTDIDWTTKTARWDAAILDDGGHPQVADDTNVPMTIAVARCPGCFTFGTEMQGGGRLAGVQFSENKLTSLDYSEINATDVLLTNSEAGGAAAAAPAESGTGTCSLVCGESVDCKPNVAKADCNVHNPLFSVPRCPYTFEFVEGGTCSR